MSEEERTKAIEDGRLAHVAIDGMIEDTRRSLVRFAKAGAYEDVLWAQERVELLCRAREALVNAELSLTYGQR